MGTFARQSRYDDEEETVTRPLDRPQRWMLPARRELRTDHSIELEDPTEPRGKLPDFSCDEDWIATNELPRKQPGHEPTVTIAPPARVRVADQPLPLVRPRQSSLPPIPAFTRPPTSSRPVLPPVPAFTRPLRLAPKRVPIPAPAPARRRPTPVPPRPVTPAPQPEPLIELREDLRVDWQALESIPTDPLPKRPVQVAYRPRQETVRGIEIVQAMSQRPPEIRYTPVPAAVSEPLPSAPLSDVSPCTLPTARPSPLPAPAPPRTPSLTDRRSLGELWRAARSDAWTAFLVLPIAVCLVSIVVLTLTAWSSPAATGNRRIVMATDEKGTVIQSATVFVDGAAKCQLTPCALELPEGTHWISVAANGYEAPPARAIQGGEDGPLQIDFVLGSEPRPLRVERPAAAPIARALPEPVPSPRQSEPAAPESSEPAPAEKPERRAQAVAPAPPRTLVTPRAAAVAKTSRLNINAIPAANVVLDGRPLGRTPQIGVPVAPGDHTVVFINGKQRVVRGARVAPGKTAVVAARL